MRKLHLAVMLICLVVAACSQDKTYRIGVSQCSTDDWRLKMNDEIMREIMFHPGVEVEIRSADDDSETQIADIRYFIDKKFDIIVVAPNEAEPLTPIINEAYEKGIPVVLFDRKILNDSFTAFQGVDNVQLGKAAANYASTLLPNGGRILEILGLDGSTPSIERREGFHSTMEEMPGFDFAGGVYGDWSYEKAFSAVDSFIGADSDIDLIYAHNDRMAIAASEVARKHGIKPRIIGIDAAPSIGMAAVANGVIDATFLYPTEGEKLMKTTLAILKGEPFERIVDLPVASAIDRSNADILLMQTASLEEETQKLGILKRQMDDYWEKHYAQSTVLTAIIFILLFAFIIIFVVFRAYWFRKRNHELLEGKNRKLEEQKNELIELNERLNEATASKLMFFTNVSHDLRTPLTLISEPVEQLSQGANLTPQQRTLIKIADKNIRILKRLINQILDFRSYENHRLKLNLIEVNLSQSVKEWGESFDAMARKHHMDYSVDVERTPDIIIGIDAEKIERVFFNLVSNAFKYTPDKGRINVSCRRKDETVEIVVSDNGQGISPDDLKKIFERFFQVDEIHPKGSGIGLSLAKAFVELHEGTLTAESELGKGSRFTVTLPMMHVSEKPVEIAPRITREDVVSELETIETGEPEITDGKPLMLVVDDNEDICRMVCELMSEEYNVITAHDGQNGLRMATKYVPDIIVCDVMMAVMDGLECCRSIKAEVSTSHIPVLMLTACSLDEQRVEGFDSGADGYLAKPFNTAVLKSHCRMLIENRVRIMNVLERSVPSKPVKPSVNLVEGERKFNVVRNIDSEFYDRFIKLVDKEMSDPDLSVDGLASELGLARSQFYRKIKALTNYSPVELLRMIRLRKSRELLMSTGKSISEIAYEVGFASAAYFTKCYKEEFGETPSQMRERMGM